MPKPNPGATRKGGSKIGRFAAKVGSKIKSGVRRLVNRFSIDPTKGGIFG
jgi:hypothetical protein